MKLRELLISCLLLAGCGSTPGAFTNGSTQTQSQRNAGFQIQGFKGDTSIARIRVESSSGAQVETALPLNQNSLILTLTNLPPGVLSFTLLALDARGQTISHYLVQFEGPGHLQINLGQFTPGPPRGAPGLNQWVKLSTRPVAGNPDLTETLWKTDVDVSAPFQRSPYDVIGLHRVASSQRRPGRSLLFLPGAQCNGNLYTAEETRDFRLYLANRGYDVYSLDYRIHFAPPPGLVAPDLRFMSAWDARTFISDVHQAVLKIQTESGPGKIFLSGFSSGGQFTYFYACSQQAGGLGQKNLAGLIVIDGGPWQEAAPNQAPNSLSMALARNTLLAGDTPANRAILTNFGLEPGEGYYSQAFGNLLDDTFLANVAAYFLDPADAAVSAYLIDRFQNNWGLNAVGDGQFTNIQRNYNDLPGLLAWSILAADSYWPMIVGLEDTVLTNYAGTGPFHIPHSSQSGVEYLDRLNQISAPQIAFGTTGLDGYLGTQLVLSP